MREQLFSSRILRNGGDAITLQMINGHRSEKVTRRYVHLVAADVAVRHRSASPLERLRA